MVTLQHESYAEMFELFLSVTLHRNLLEMVSCNRKIDADTLWNSSLIQTSYADKKDLQRALDELSEAGVLWFELLPAVYEDRIEDLYPFYSINKRTVRTLNKISASL